MRRGSNPPAEPNTWKNPHGPSSASAPAVNPRAASSAATTPLWAARPTWSGLVIVPKFTRMPALDAGGDGERVGGLRSIEAQQPRRAAAAPKVPIVPEEWKPF